MAANPNTTFSAGNVLTAGQMNRLPWGVVGYQQLTTVFSTAATHTTYQDTGLTLTMSLNTSRLYKWTVIGNPYPSGGQQGIVYRLVEGSTGKLVWNLASASLETGASMAVTLSGYYIPSSSSSTTYKIQMKASAANTAVSDYGATDQPRQFIVEDMGPN